MVRVRFRALARPLSRANTMREIPAVVPIFSTDDASRRSRAQRSFVWFLYFALTGLNTAAGILALLTVKVRAPSVVDATRFDAFSLGVPRGDED
jgi:hypothetical protein